MQEQTISVLQRELGLHERQLSGQLDEATVVACHQLLHAQHLQLASVNWQNWPAPRQAVLALQLCCKQAGFMTGL